MDNGIKKYAAGKEKRMKTYILCYETFTLFEIVLVAYMFNTSESVNMIGVDKSAVTSYESIRIMPEYRMDEIELTEKDLLVIPGGDIRKIPESGKMKKLLDTAFEKKCKVAAICAGIDYLEEQGYLNGYRTAKTTDEDVVIDRNLITAKPNAFVEFAVETANMFGILGDEAGYQETIQFFKNIKS